MLGHDFVETGEKIYINQDMLNAPDPCYVTGGLICTRCQTTVDPDDQVNHSYPDFDPDSSEWTEVSATVYKAYCRNGCGCYILHSTCTWTSFVVPPTCTEDGYTEYICSCGEHNYNSDFDPALGHQIPFDIENPAPGELPPADTGVIIKSPTCTEEGIFRCYCIRYDNGVTCDKYIDFPIPPLGHSDITRYDATAVTCTVDGNTEYYRCGVCEKYYADALCTIEIELNSWMIPATGHADVREVEWVVTDEAGCGKTGWKKKFCNHVNADTGIVCGEVIDEEEILEIPALYYVAKYENAELVSGDEYDGVWQPTSCTVNGILYWTCKNCENTPNAHSSQPFVVYEAEDIGILEHDEAERITKEAYCICPGQKESYCLRCDAVLAEEIIEAPETDHNLVEIKEEGGCIYKKCTNTPCEYIEPGDHDFRADADRSIAATCTEEGLDAYTCSRCGETNDTPIAATGHNHVPVETVPSTCEESGYSIYECRNINNGTVCEDRKNDDFTEPLGHELVKTDAKDPTCETDGNYEYFTCLRDYCQKMFFDENAYKPANPESIVVPKLGHNYTGTVRELNNGTHDYLCVNGCGTYGFNTVKNDAEACFDTADDADCVCDKCGHFVAHTWVAADCLTAKTCSVCAETEGDPLGHDWDEGVINPDATCTVEGTITYTCKRDASHTFTEAINPTGHTPVTDESVAPTCTKTGLTEGSHCGECNAELTKQEIIPVVGHTFGTWIPGENKTHSRTCTVCTDEPGRTETENCIDAADDTDCSCDKCMQFVAHTPVTDAYVAPTCTETGLTEGSHCAVCNAMIVEQEIIPARGHEYILTSNNDGTHTYTCAYADDSHQEDCTFVLVSSTVPTMDAEGSETYTCTACGYSYTNVLPKLKTFIVTFKGYNYESSIKVLFDTTIDQIDFPEPPAKTNFVASWPTNVVLNNKDIVIECLYKEIDSEIIAPIESNKEAEYANGIVSITLSAFSESSTVKYATGKALDIVLVLDQSGSMETNDKYKYLQVAANSFIDTLYETGVNHRVAVAGFAMGANAFSAAYPAFMNTGLFSKADGEVAFEQYSEKLSESYYENAFFDVMTEKDIIKNDIINNIAYKGATAADYGMKIAANILAANDDSENEKIVVFFTDGVPTTGSNFEYPVADGALANADALKSFASIYSVGIFDDGDASENVKKFLNRISSNYIDIESMDDSEGIENENGGYFILVENQEELNKSFQNIVNSMAYKVENFDNLTFVDTLTKEFTMTQVQEDAFRADLMTKYKIGNADIQVTRNDDGTTRIVVSDITPKATELEDGRLGYLAEICFDVTANEKTLVGGTFETNTEDAGVIIGKNEKFAAVFKIPSVKIEDGRCLVRFNINGEPYCYAEYTKGEQIIAPAYGFDPVCQFSGWNVEGLTANSELTVVNATLSVPEFTITWVINGEEITQSVLYGDYITAPEVKVPNFDFLGWLPDEIPETMPARNLWFTAVLTDENHQHSYLLTREQKASCGIDGYAEFTCSSCSDTYTENYAALTHSYTAVSQTETNESYNVFICRNCGKASGKYLVQKFVKNGKRETTTYVDLSMRDDFTIETQPDGEVKVTLVLSDKQYESATQYAVVRVNDDGTYETMSAKQSGAIVTFYTDHFCHFIIGEINPETGALYEFDHEHAYAEAVTLPTCTTDGYTTYTCSCADSYVGNYVDALGHDMQNGVCKTCGYDENNVNCDHLCHKDGILGCFWRILCFFMKLFKTNEYCSCGAKHW